MGWGEVDGLCLIWFMEEKLVMGLGKLEDMLGLQRERKGNV